MLKKDKANVVWEIIAVIVALVGIVVSVAIGVATYNTSYEKE